MRMTFIAVIAAVLFTGVWAEAHHSYAAFDRERQVSIEGTIEEIEYVNPHTIVKVRTKDGQLFRAEWGTTAQLQRAGALYTLKTGDHIIMTGAPARDESLHLVSLLKEVRRPADGWSWSTNARPAPPTGQ